MDKNGNSCIGYSDTLISVDYDGNLNWKKNTEKLLYSHISIDAYNNLYFITCDGYFDLSINLHSWGEDGNTRWSISESKYNDYSIQFPLVCAFDQTLMLWFRGNKLVKIN
jgi:hypothetical protein